MVGWNASKEKSKAEWAEPFWAGHLTSRLIRVNQLRLQLCQQLSIVTAAWNPWWWAVEEIGLEWTVVLVFTENPSCARSCVYWIPTMCQALCLLLHLISSKAGIRILIGVPWSVSPFRVLFLQTRNITRFSSDSVWYDGRVLGLERPSSTTVGRWHNTSESQCLHL